VAELTMPLWYLPAFGVLSAIGGAAAVIVRHTTVVEEQSMRPRRERPAVRPVPPRPDRPAAPTDADLARWSMDRKWCGQPWLSATDCVTPMDVIEEGDATPRCAPPETPAAARIRRLRERAA
jgi:hypothetical protein